MKKYIFLAFYIILAILLIGCGGEQQSTDTDKAQAVDRVTVTFKTNCDEMIPQTKVAPGTTIYTPTNIKKEGYVLDGWYLNGEKWISESTVNENITLEAKWIPLEYKITYHMGEGTVHTYTIEDEIELPCVEEENSIFIGWSTDIEGENLFTSLKKGTTGNLELYAVKTYFKMEFTELEDGSYEISGYERNDDKVIEHLILPSEYNGKPVTSIGEDAFQWLGSVTTLEIPSSIKTIGIHSFYCTRVKKIIVNEGVESIKRNAFAGAKTEEIHLADSIVLIDENAFSNCQQLKTINLPKSLIGLGYCAFAGCKELSIDVVIPEGVTMIIDETFINCEKIKSVKLHENITYIGDQAFQKCTGIKELEIFSGSIGMYAFYSCYSLEKLTIHNDVTKISKCAFDRCNLKDVMIYQGVDIIEYNAFLLITVPIYTDATEKPKGWQIDVVLADTPTDE